MSLPSRSHAAGHAREVDPYREIVALLRRQQEELPTPDAKEADAAFKQIVELMLKLFAEYAQRHGSPPLRSDHVLTATEAAVVSTHLLRAVDIALFELAMWQSWAGGGDITDMHPGSLANDDADE